MDLKTINYEEYLKTDHWKNFRQKALQYHGNKCCKCGTLKHLQVHHLTYERRGCELLSDVIVVCEKCHQRIHNSQYNDMINELWEKYNLNKITIDEFSKEMLPVFVLKTNIYYYKFYDFFKNDLKQSNYIIINDKKKFYYENAYWGLDNVYNVFLFCIEKYNPIKSKYDFARYFNINIKYGFTKCYQKGMKGKFSKKTKENEKREFLIKQIVSFDAQDNNTLKNLFEKMDDNKCLMKEMELDIQMKDFMSNYLNIKESIVFKYILNKYYYDEEYTNQIIANNMNMSIRNVIRYKNKIRKLFIQYFNEEST